MADPRALIQRAHTVECGRSRDGDRVGDVPMWDSLPNPVHLTQWSPAEFAAWEAHREEMRRRLSWRWPDHTEVLRVPPDGDRAGR